MNKIKFCFAVQFRSAICSKLENRSLLSFTGPDAYSVLQGISTNDVLSFQRSQMQSLYTLFLNTQGRIVSDAILVKPKRRSGSDWAYTDELWLDVDYQLSPKLLKHIKTYLIRKKVQIHDITEEVDMRVVYSQSMKPGKSKLGEELVYESDGDVEEGDYKNTVYNDPRTSALGLRMVSSPDQIELHSDIVQAHPSYYQAFRYSVGVLEGAELEGQIPFLANLDFLNAINFNKGCYIGQELTARTFHTGIVRRRCLPFKVLRAEEDSELVELRTEFEEDLREQKIMDQGKEVGKVMFNKYNLGVGLFTYLENELDQRMLKIGDHNVRIDVHPELADKLQNYVSDLQKRQPPG